MSENPCWWGGAVGAPSDSCGQADEGGWRNPKRSRASLGSRRHLRRTLSAALLLAGLTAAFVAVSCWFRPPPPACLLLIGAGYEDNLELPPNLAGRIALERFARLAGNSSPFSAIVPRSGRLRLGEGIIELRTGSDWSARLGRCPERTLIVLLAAHGGADTEGPYLLPSDADSSPEARIRFEEVVNRLASLPAEKNKVLIVDATALEDHWALGMLHNGFVEAVAAMEDRIAAVPNLIVILSSDVDQTSWSRGIGGTSVFSHFLLEGLVRGAQKRDGAWFTAWDLYRDVRDRVQQWALTYRQAPQTPLLLPRQEGHQRAQAIPLMFHLADVPDQEPADPLPAIEAAWQRYHNLRREAPAALIRTPQLFRGLEALTLRHEQVLLAGGGGASVEGIRDLALATEAEIRRRQVLTLRSMTTTLAMPALAGEVGFSFPQSYEPFDKLWAAQPDDRAALWAKLQNAEGPGWRDRALVRGRVLALLIQQAAENPQSDLARAAELVSFLHEASQAVPPAEAHFLVMLNRDLPKPLSGDSAPLISRALKLRLLAEQAAMGLEPGKIPYCEFVLPWVRQTIAAADIDRRLGEDLLFATEPEDLAEAARYLTRAEKGYRQAMADAATVRLAIEQRDQALYELPHYARWASRSPIAVLAEVGPAIAGLWGQVHELSQALELPASRSRLPRLKSLGEQVQLGLARLRAGLDKSVQTAIQADTADLQTLCALLEVPTLAVPVRMAILKKRLQLERRALEGVEGPGGPHRATVADPNALRLRACLRGEMALAALGERSFNLASGGGDKSWAELRRRVQSFTRDPSWRPSLLQAQAEIGLRWRWLGAEADRLADRAKSETDPDRIRTLVWEGDQFARRSLTLRGASSASRKLRILLTVEALLFHACRAEADHWADARPAAVPYYQTAARTLLRDVRLISQEQSFHLAGLAELEALLDRADMLDLEVTPRVHLTPGDAARLTVSPAGTLRPGLAGFPVVWSEVASLSPLPGKQALSLSDWTPGRRRVMPVGQDIPRTPWRVEVQSPLLEHLEDSPPSQPEPLPARLVWSSLHRGFCVEKATEVFLHPRAEVVFSKPAPPPNAAVAVTADPLLVRRMSRARGAMAIVLDCSGSMGARSDEPSGEATRFQLVTRALEELLENVPAGTTLSLWVFGQAVGEEKTVKPAEAGITRLVEPVTWTGEREQLREVLLRVRELVPWNESPILRAMVAARQDLVRADGPRTMIVLTDGIDNRFAKDREGNPAGESVPEALRRWFGGTAIAVHVVGFQIANREDEEARRQFSPVAALDPPGTFCTVDAIEDLLATIRRVARPTLNYRLTYEDGVEVSGARTPLCGSVGTDDEPFRWLTIPLEGRTRGLRLHLDSAVQAAGNVVLAPGDGLSLRLMAQGTGACLTKWPLVSRTDLPNGRVFSRNGWLAALPLYERAGTDGLRLLLTLEPQPEQPEDPIRVRCPADIWVELGPSDGRSVAVVWRPTAGYAAPAWEFEVPAWPVDTDHAPVPTVLRAWWLADGKAAPFASLRRQEDFRTPEHIPRNLRVDGGELVIESVRVEPRPRDTGSDTGRPTPQTRWCVAVRILHPPDFPVRASLEGLGTLRSEEHRWYRAAGKYVGLFEFAGFSTEQEAKDRLDNELKALHLTSLRALRQQAEQEGHAIECVNLGRPGPRVAALEPPVRLE